MLAGQILRIRQRANQILLQRGLVHRVKREVIVIGHLLDGHCLSFLALSASLSKTSMVSATESGKSSTSFGVNMRTPRLHGQLFFTLH